MYYGLRICGIETLPFHADIALLMVSFMVIGEKSYKWLHGGVNSLAKAITLLLISAILFSLFAYISDASMDLNIGIVPSIWWLYSIPVLGYGMVYGAAWIVDRYGGRLNNPLLWLGRNSLLVMCLHEPIKRILIKVFAVALHSETDAVRQSLPISLIIAMAVLLVCYPLAVVISSKMPWMTGKSLQK